MIARLMVAEYGIRVPLRNERERERKRENFVFFDENIFAFSI